jgi:hypothetical protein
VLKIERKNGEALSTLLVRKTTEAQKAGLLPHAGQSKLMFGNVLEKDIVLTIDKTKVKIAAGLGAKKPDGRCWRLRPVSTSTPCACPASRISPKSSRWPRAISGASSSVPAVCFRCRCTDCSLSERLANSEGAPQCALLA